MIARWKRKRQIARLYHARYRAHRRALHNRRDWARWGIEVEVDF
jgi:hypothetical protein